MYKIGYINIVIFIFWFYSVQSASFGLERWCPINVTSEYNTSCFLCALNSRIPCNIGDIKLTEDEGVKGCLFGMTKIIGCQHTCNAVETMLQCCTGYWGIDCLACPGDLGGPCESNGNCSDGYNGTGVCQCKPGFKGFACELCNDVLAFGPDCLQKCDCVHGSCSNGPTGDGTCLCEDSYDGPRCENKLKTCDTMECDLNAYCIYPRAFSSEPTCLCNQGFTGNGTYCTEIDLCKVQEDSPDGPKCHDNSTCSIDKKQSPWTIKCTCLPGFNGDGYECLAIDPCQVKFGGCDIETTDCVYISPNKSECVCFDGYVDYIEGEGCSIEDLCPTAGVLKCDKNALCSMPGPKEITCTCPAGFIGDGTYCYGNIIQRLKDLNTNDTELKGQLSYAIRLLEFAYNETFVTDGPFTLFISHDKGFHLALSSAEDQFKNILTNIEYGRTMLRHHTIAKMLSVEDLLKMDELYTLQGVSVNRVSSGNVVYGLNGTTTKAAVIKRDIVASNGIIHIIDRMIDKKPDIPSSMSEPVLQIIKKMFSGAAKLFQDLDGIKRQNLTVFVPSNKVFEDLPEGTIEHLLDPTESHKLNQIIRNHIVNEELQIYAVDLLNKKRFVSIGNTAVEIKITQNGRITLGNNSTKITQTDILGSDGVIHVIDKILLPKFMDSLVPNRCDEKSSRSVMGPCSSCHAEQRCQETGDIPVGPVKHGCIMIGNRDRFRLHYPLFDRPYGSHIGYPISPLFSRNDRHRSLMDHLFPLKGCNKLCNRVKQINKCCDGFYGQECYSCPGGFKNPCFGRGKCLDGMTNSGKCVCDSKYSGAVCEFCSDVNMYGPYCNQTCSCIHGECLNSVESIKKAFIPGKCKPGTCKDGYMGNDCQEQIERCTRSGLRCHAHANCIKRTVERSPWDFSRRRKNRRKPKNKSNCLCKTGYTGNGFICKEINPCDSGTFVCHNEARCVKTAPGQAKCVCDAGWVGDGYYCYPSTPCINGTIQCHSQAQCVTIGPGQAHCECMAGYHGNGTYCVATNMCLIDNGGCDRNAICNATGPGKVACSCVPELAGDGFSCYGSIAFEVEMRKELKEIKALLQKIPPQHDFLSDMVLNFTFFAPNNSAVSSFLKKTDSAWTNEANLLTLLSYHVVPQLLTVSDLYDRVGDNLQPLAQQYQLNISTDTDSVVINEAEILEGDIWALNGIIHIVDAVLEPYPPPIVLLSLEGALLERSEFSIFLYFLKKTGILYSLDDQKKYTVFAPLNQAWKMFNLKEITKSYLSYYIIPGKTVKTSDIANAEKQSFTTLLGNDMNLKGNNSQIFIDEELVDIGLPDVVSYQGYIQGLTTLLHPVLTSCLKHGQKKNCCSGYYGPQCKVCPSGESNICSDHGNCLDGIQGDGTCNCTSGYSGKACEICQDDANCKQDLCSVGNGDCGAFGNCSVEDNLVKCRCILGYVFDGGICKFPCEVNNGGCHTNAMCQLQDESVSCECLADFLGNGYQCVHRLGPCGNKNGGCSKRAKCALQPSDNPEVENVLCSCSEGFIGNGYKCNGNLWLTLQDLSEDRPTIQTLIKMMKGSKIAELLKGDEEHKNYTLFVPLYGNMEKVDPYSLIVTGYTLLDNTVNQTIELNSLDGAHLVITIDYQNSETDELEFQQNAVRVIVRNIVSTNGIIHLVNNTVNIRGREQRLDTKPDYSLSQKHVMSIGGGIGILAVIIIVVVLGLLAYKKWPIISNGCAQMVSIPRNFSFRKLDEEPSPSIYFQSGVFNEDVNETDDAVLSIKQPSENLHL